jgi:hypothetical protein
VPAPEALQQQQQGRGSHLQFTLVDCPGHASLIRTIIGGAQIIDTMILVIDVTKGAAGTADGEGALGVKPDVGCWSRGIRGTPQDPGLLCLPAPLVAHAHAQAFKPRPPSAWWWVR